MLDSAQFSPWLLEALLIVCFLSVSLNVYAYWPGYKSSSHLLPSLLDTQPEDDTTPLEVTKETEPDSESLTSERLFQLERRAIFSKAWLCVSHRSRFGKPGDYVTYDVAGYPFFLILGRDNTLRAFHNVCRHRAYGITRKAAGSSLVLGCKYHGWSYDTKGQLTKAPQFEGVPGFDKSQNGLFEIHSRIDAHGFVYVNLDASEEAKDLALPEVWRWGRPSVINHNSCWLHCFELKGRFNWKVAFGNENQSVGGLPATFAGLPMNPLLRTLAVCGFDVTGWLHFFPLATVYTKMGSPFWYKITFSPDAAGQTTVWCDVYSTWYKNAFQFEGSVKENLEKEIKAKIQDYEQKHASLVATNTAFRTAGCQDAIESMLNEHRKKERASGTMLHPAAVQQCRSSAFAAAEKLCQELDEMTARYNPGVDAMAW